MVYIAVDITSYQKLPRQKQNPDLTNLNLKKS